jgi:hypothetical protein
MVDHAGLVDAVLSSYGESLAVRVGNVDFPLTGAFLAPHVGTTLAGVPVERTRPQVVARLADWAALAPAPKRGDGLVRGERLYTIADIATDDAGFVTLDVRDYA